MLRESGGYCVEAENQTVLPSSSVQVLWEGFGFTICMGSRWRWSRSWAPRWGRTSRCSIGVLLSRDFCLCCSWFYTGHLIDSPKPQDESRIASFLQFSILEFSFLLSSHAQPVQGKGQAEERPLVMLYSRYSFTPLLGCLSDSFDAQLPIFTGAACTYSCYHPGCYHIEHNYPRCRFRLRDFL